MSFIIYLFIFIGYVI